MAEICFWPPKQEEGLQGQEKPPKIYPTWAGLQIQAQDMSCDFSKSCVKHQFYYRIESWDKMGFSFGFGFFFQSTDEKFLEPGKF